MLVDNGVTKNYISPAIVVKMELPHRQKWELYLLVMISGDFILYGDGMIHFETELVQLDIKKKIIIMLFNVLSLGKNKAVLKILFL